MNALTIPQSQTLEVLPQPQPVAEHPVIVYLASLQSAGSRDVMKRNLNNVAQLLSYSQHDALTYPWHTLRYQHLNALKAKLLETSKYTAVNVKLSAVKGVLKAAWRQGLMDSDTYHRTVDVPQAKGETVPKGRNLSAGELHTLFAVCAADRDLFPATAARDSALLAVFYSVAGPRVGEVVALDLADYDSESGQLLIRSGKGNKERTNYLEQEGRAALDDWITVRGDKPGPLFCPVNRGGNVVRDADGTPQRMTTRAIFKMFVKRAQQGGLKPFSPHDMRRTCVGDMIDRGVDIVTVKQLLGHASIATTERYDRRGERRKKKAASVLHVPYENED